MWMNLNDRGMGYSKIFRKDIGIIIYYFNLDASESLTIFRGREIMSPATNRETMSRCSQFHNNKVIGT